MPSVIIFFLFVLQIYVVSSTTELTAHSKLLFGVPLDYSYNEIRVNPHQFISSPGCPKSIDGYPWVWHGETNTRCYLVGSNPKVCYGGNPCNDNQVMHLQLGSHFGVCSCNIPYCVERAGKENLEDIGNFTYCSSGCDQYVYDKMKKRCLTLYSQGPCARNEWLAKNSHGEPECGPKICPESEFFRKVVSAPSGHQTEIHRCGERCTCVASSGNSFLPNKHCTKEKFYSNTLKKCIERIEKASMIIG